MRRLMLLLLALAPAACVVPGGGLVRPFQQQPDQPPPLVYHVIKAAAGAGGRISPSGSVSAEHGKIKTFVMTPEQGYAIKQVYVDGIAVGAARVYNFPPVKRDHRIAALFTRVSSKKTAPTPEPAPDIEQVAPREETAAAAPPDESRLAGEETIAEEAEAPAAAPANTLKLSGLNARDKGLAIATAARERERGFGSYTASISMTLRNRNGDEVHRSMGYRALEIANDGDRSLATFSQPSDIRGTALLTHAHRKGDDDQWLYLPAVARVKRISTNNKSGSFMGSEFAFEDLASQETERFTYEWLRDEACGKRKCHVVNATPKDRDSGYARQTRYWEQDTLRLVKIVFYDRRNAQLKTLEQRDWKLHVGRFWRAATYEMQNHQTGKSTTLRWSQFNFSAGLREKDFTTSTLTRLP